MFQSIKEVNNLVIQAQKIKDYIKNSLSDFLRGGVECAYENNRYIILPGNDFKSFNDSFNFAINYFSNNIKNNIKSKVCLKYIISGDTSNKSFYTENFFNKVLKENWYNCFRNINKYKQERLAMAFSQSDFCIKDYYRYGLIPSESAFYPQKINEETVQDFSDEEDGAYYIPISNYNLFINKKKLYELRTEVNFPILLVYENTNNPEELYYSLVLYSSENNI